VQVKHAGEHAARAHSSRKQGGASGPQASVRTNDRNPFLGIVSVMWPFSLRVGG
jgi:hypothetical protein